MESQQYSTFYLQNLLFGVKVYEVQEVLRPQEMTPVPRSSPVVEGLINLRGQIITAIDLRRRLGLPPRKEGDGHMNVVLRMESGPISILVDRVGDVLDVADEAFEPSPDTLAGGCSELVSGVAKLQSGLLLLLDTEKAVQVG